MNTNINSIGISKTEERKWANKYIQQNVDSVAK